MDEAKKKWQENKQEEGIQGNEGEQAFLDIGKRRGGSK